ncbi:type I CRISPR-associated protein Cas8a1/Csx8 [Romboutsia timonensis]|uniref:type I CRISPR-associated protein Cas8a1/Csx8 n=1 Tax=Romboutsia timonensis TaxID=1776391 RepID=UPI0008D8FC7E|nr:type I CRISPR-associated protein Cas8a1/Csx8 [Romboutsia timonensis]
MKTILENNTDFNVKLEPSDWRFSAAIVGILEYFEYIDTLETSYKVEDEYILYNSELITKENYLKFVEKKYGENLHHKYVELNLEHYNQDNNENDNTYIIKSINEKLSGNTIMKKIFKKIKFDGTNRDEILSLVNKHREELILETFRNKSDMYKNYCNTNQLFNENQKYCRLVGYYIDAPKKGKSTGFGFNMSSFVGQDIQEFDFIPFAFINDRESLFINDNYEINRLTSAKQVFQEKIKADIENLELENKYRGIKYSLFKGIIESSDFIEYDVEVIVKDRDKDYFETLYIRKQSIDILKKINERKIDYNSLCFSYKINDNYYIDIYKKVMECILNNTLLDDVIDLLLKEKKNYYTVYQLININDLIRGEKIMDDKIRKIIHACANEVRNKIPENKLESYRQKLTSSIIFKDYDRVCQILLQLSGYSDVYFSFADELFMDFEKNKDIAYTFINALGKSNKINENTNKQN